MVRPSAATHPTATRVARKPAARQRRVTRLGPTATTTTQNWVVGLCPASATTRASRLQYVIPSCAPSTHRLNVAAVRTIPTSAHGERLAPQVSSMLAEWPAV